MHLDVNLRLRGIAMRSRSITSVRHGSWDIAAMGHRRCVHGRRHSSMRGRHEAGRVAHWLLSWVAWLRCLHGRVAWRCSCAWWVLVH